MTGLQMWIFKALLLIHYITSYKLMYFSVEMQYQWYNAVLLSVRPSDRQKSALYPKS